MKKLVLIVGLAAVAMLAVGASLQEQEVPEDIMLENPKGNVGFPHKAHVDLGYACNDCHHNMEDDAAMPEDFCHDCHTADSDVTAKDAFHKSCKDCHKEYKKEHPDSGAPTSCKACHG